LISVSLWRMSFNEFWNWESISVVDAKLLLSYWNTVGYFWSSENIYFVKVTFDL
jgi:hypothetical protein